MLSSYLFKCQASFPEPAALLSTLIVPNKFRARMVNYHDPNTVAQDFGPYALRLSQMVAAQFTSPSFNRGTREALARRGWIVHVCLLPCRLPPGLYEVFCSHADPSHVAGNSSLPLTMSGMSSEDVAQGDGQCGFVVFIRFSHRSPTTED